MSILYKEISEKIYDYINTLPSGADKLPPERELCNIFDVSRQTIRHALDRLEEIGYIIRRPGSGIYLTDSFKRSRNRIAILVPDRDHYIFPGLISELDSRFNSFAYTLDVYETHDRSNEIYNCLNHLLNHPVSCILIYPIRNAISTPAHELLQKLNQFGTRIIFIGDPYPNADSYTYIKQDHYYSAYSLAGRIIAHAKPWCAIFMHDNQSSYDKYLGLSSGFLDLDLVLEEDRINWISYEEYCALDKKKTTAISNIIHSQKVFPSVFICENDLVAYWLTDTLKREHLLNDEITIYSFDGSYILKITEQKIYSYGTGIASIATTIVEKVLENNAKEKEAILLPTSLHD